LDQAKSLGSANIDLEDIEPLTAIDRTLTLSSEKYGNKGEIKINMVFHPEIIMRSRKSTSTFSAAGRTMTAIGSAPINAGKGVLQGVATVFKRGKESDEVPSLVGFGAPPAPNIPGTQVSQPVGDGDTVENPVVPASAMNGYSIPAEPVALKVSVLDAKDLTGGPDVKPYAVVHIGEKEHKTKHAGKTVAPEWYAFS
jgi:Ca2+-dependent lipid-binding protein